MWQDFLDTVIDTAVSTKSDGISDNFAVGIEKDHGRNGADVVLIHDRLRAGIVHIDRHKCDFVAISCFGLGNDSVELLTGLAPGG